jgi:replicative DNA helicase
MAERLPIPEDPNAERTLVSCVYSGFRMADAESQKAILELEADAFHVPQARAIWAAMLALYKANDPIDPATIHGQLMSMKLDGVVGGYSGIMEILTHDEFGNAEPLVRRLKELNERRKMIRLAIELDMKARDLVLDPAEARSHHATALLALDIGGRSNPRRSGPDLAYRLGLCQSFRKGGAAGKLLRMPITRWDDAIECAPGHVVVLGARPKVGKTAFAVDSMVLTANCGNAVGFISLEMDNDEVEARLAARMTGMNATKFAKGEWHLHEVQHAMAERALLEKMHWWCHPSGVPWARIEAEIREMVRLNGVRAVIIDYFTLIGKPTGAKGATDATLWGALSMSIKRLAQELGICILLLAQLNRGGAEGEPHSSDLRETGQLEQDANAIILLWKEKVDGPVWGKVGENRSGPAVGKRELEFDGGTCIFKPGSKETSPAGGTTPSGWGGSQS